jgi:hypothetical protein
MPKTETAIRAQQLTKRYRGDRLAIEQIGFVRLHAACRRPRLRAVRPRQAMSSIG